MGGIHSRRRFLRTTGAAILGGALQGGTATALEVVTEEDWPQVGLDSVNTNYAPEHTSPSTNISEKWCIDDIDIDSPPVIAGDAIYISGHNTIHSRSIIDGSERWVRDTTDQTSAPTIAGESVYVGTGKENSHYGNVYSIAAADGSIEWSHSTAYDAFQTPTVVSGTVYSGTYGGSAAVFALSAADGGVEWRTESESVNGLMAVTDSATYYGETGNVRSLGNTDGKEEWAYRAMPNVGNPAVDKGTVFVGERTYGYLYALSVADGSEEWAIQGTDGEKYGEVAGAPAVSDAMIYFGVSVEEGGYVVAVSRNGDERWRIETNGGVFASPIVAGNTLYVGDAAGTLYALAPSTGTEYWQRSLDSGIYYNSAVANGELYVATRERLYALSGDEATPVPTQTPTITPSSTEAPTETPTPTSVSTPNPGPEEEDREKVIGQPVTTAGSRKTKSDDSELYPVAALGVLGAAGAGTWWYRRTDSRASSLFAADSAADTEGAALPESYSDSPHEQQAEPLIIPSHRIPTSVPMGPELTVEYDDLLEKDAIASSGGSDVALAKVETDSGEYQLAIKRPLVSGTLHNETAKRLLQEAETWSKLDDHENIVDIIGYGHSPLPWIAMEYMDGGNLQTRVEGMSTEEALWIGQELADAVYHAHRHGIVHLDLKPANVLFRNTGKDTWDVPKVGDWGLSRSMLNQSETIEGLSPHYAAPEQFDSETYGAPDEQTDIYQLGVILYELLVGQPPFDGSATAVMRDTLETNPPTPTDIDPGIPDQLDEIISTALAKNKENRFETVVHFREAIEALFEE